MSRSLVSRYSLKRSLVRFLKAQGFHVDRFGSRFELSLKLVPGYILRNLSKSEVLDYAKNHCYPGFKLSTRRNKKSTGPVLSQKLEIKAAQVCTSFEVINSDYRQVTPPENCLTVTDPPYGVGYKYDQHDDRMSDQQWLEMMSGIQKPCVLILPHEKVWVLVQDPHWGAPDDYVTWVYNGGYRGHQQRMIVWYGCKPDMTREAVGQPFKDPKSRWAKKALLSGRTHAQGYHWWHVEQIMSKNREKTAHPCQIPEEVKRRIILSTAMPGQPTFDPFCGSGTTGVVAVRHGHPFVGCDVSATYCQIARKRIGSVLPLKVAGDNADQSLSGHDEDKVSA